MSIVVLIFWYLKLAAVATLGLKLRLLGSKRKPPKHRALVNHSRQSICIQVPLYNEPHHCQDVLMAVSRLDWPNTQLEIQVLDDSTDETTLLITNTLKHLQETHPSLKITHLTRTERTGYKAGALNYGMAHSSAHFFAIFDCDFRPRPDFLKRMMNPFVDSQVAAVQARWTYNNPKANWLTRLQVVMLNSHFLLEQWGRSDRGFALNFNGTAGIWRRSALESMGNWQSSSVTEDLLLSFQSWLAGWKLVFLPEVGCSSELPSDLASLLIQQRRWAKGSGQVLRLAGLRILREKTWHPLQKFDGILHLWGYGLATIFFLAYLFIPLWIQGRAALLTKYPIHHPYVVADTSIWIICGTVFAYYYGNPIAQKQIGNTQWKRIQNVFALALAGPLFVALIAPSFYQGFTHRPGKDSQVRFYRTPKLRDKRPLSMLDRMTVLSLTLFSGYCTLQAYGEGMYLAGFLFLAQTLLFPNIARVEPQKNLPTLQNISRSNRAGIRIKARQVSQTRAH